MAGFMEGYGAGEETRNRVIKRTFLIGVPAILLAVGAFFYFRTWSQERAIGRFTDALEAKSYQDAYRMWCPTDKDCRFYPFQKFQEDWGPNGIYGKPEQLNFGSVDYCNTGVVFEVTYPNQQPFGLWVDRNTNVIGFSSAERCPGKHLAVGAFFKRFFGSPEPIQAPAAPR